jgi:hypothetical protein
MTIEEDNKVSVLFINEGVLTAASIDSDIAAQYDLGKHVETLGMMEVELIAEQEALASYEAKISRQEIITKPKQVINQVILEADVVMAF